MQRDAKIAGGFFVSILFFFTLQPFNNLVLQAAINDPTNVAIGAFASIYQYFHAGFLFIVLAMTLYEVFVSAE